MPSPIVVINHNFKCKCRLVARGPTKPQLIHFKDILPNLAHNRNVIGIN